MGEKLGMLCIRLSQNIPQWILDGEPVPPWLNLSMAIVYLSFAKHWLPFLPTLDVAKAVDRRMDDCFFDFVESTDFEVKVSEVIVHPTEREAYCSWANRCSGHVLGVDFEKEVSTSRTLLNLLFAIRCNQYSADLREGLIIELEGERNVLGPVIFVYKRFNQHMYAVACNERSIDLEKDLKHLTPFDSMFMDALAATQECFIDRMKTLPFSL